MKFSLRTMYLYLFSFLGLLIVVVGAIRLINVGFRAFIFPDVDTYEYVAIPRYDEQGKPIGETEEERKVRIESDRINAMRQRQREFIEAISFLLVGAPLYIYHWKTIQQDVAKERRK